ncbi:MAG: helix-hairpin-helix domain-containing protein, partial [Promethearchaeota archaeon]
KAETLCKTRNVRLIVVDSLMALMRVEYVGIGMLARRQGVLNNMIHGLSRIAETYNCAILLTNQVSVSMKGMFSANDAIGGNIVAHGCHFRVMSNNSLKRRAIIVDAPDLPPEEAEFYITSVGIADTEKGEVPEAKGLDFEVEALYEEEEIQEVGITEDATNSGEYSLIDVKGIGGGTAKNLIKNGVASVDDLLNSDPETLATKISGISSKMINEWQTNAKALLSA